MTLPKWQLELQHRLHERLLSFPRRQGSLVILGADQPLQGHPYQQQLLTVTTDDDELAEGSVDTLLVHLCWWEDISAHFAQWQHMLTDGGLCLMTALTADSFAALRAKPLPTAEDWSRAMTDFGFTEVVVDRQTLFLEYPSVRCAVKQLQHLPYLQAEPGDRLLEEALHTPIEVAFIKATRGSRAQLSANNEQAVSLEDITIHR